MVITRLTDDDSAPSESAAVGVDAASITAPPTASKLSTNARQWSHRDRCDAIIKLNASGRVPAE